MTIPVDFQREGFVGDGSTKTFTLSSSFTWWNSREMLVYYEDLTTEEYELWREGRDYTISGGKGAAGGSLTTKAEEALTSDEKIHVYRLLPILHRIDFENGKTLDHQSIERSSNRLTAIMQQIDEGLTRAIRAPLNDDGGDFIWPTKTERAGKYLGFVNDTEAEPFAADEPSAISLGANLEAIQAQITPASGYVIQWTGANTCELILTSSLTGSTYNTLDPYSPPTSPPSSLINTYEFFTGLASEGIVEIEISFSNVTSNGGNNFQIQIADTSGYVTANYESSAVEKDASGNTVAAATGGWLVPYETAAQKMNGRLRISRLDSSTNSHCYSGRSSIDEAPPHTATFGGRLGGSFMSSAIDAIRIITIGGDEFTGGTWRLTYRTE